MNDGGSVIPRSVQEDYVWTLHAQNPMRPDPEPLPPATLQQRIRSAINGFRTAIGQRLHDALFADRYCDHDGCW